MSAFICSPAHISALVRYACRNNLSLGYNIPGTPGRSVFRVAGREQETCDMLARENAASVAYRYPNDTVEAVAVVYDIAARMLSPVEALKAAQCLEYQSCEHPQWEASGARSLMEAIKSHAIRNLPGYDEAPWAIS